MFRLDGKAALVTGATGGIGAAIARALHAQGAEVALTGRRESELAALAEALGERVTVIPADLSDPEAPAALVEKVEAELGGLDILVNNAGKQTAVKAIAELTTEQFDATFRTNVYAMFWITKAALPHMPPGAAIINTTSIQAMNPSPSLLDYAPTKAAIMNFTKALAKQVAEKGIRVNAVAPGPYWTPLQSSGGQPQEKVQQFGADTPLGRPGQPVEIAPLYVLLASEECSYASGQVWCSDGGTGVA